jgi:hypothetical protein
MGGAVLAHTPVIQNNLKLNFEMLKKSEIIVLVYILTLYVRTQVFIGKQHFT